MNSDDDDNYGNHIGRDSEQGEAPHLNSSG